MDTSTASEQFVPPAPTPGTFWFPVQSSTVAPDVDWAFHFILGVCAIFFFVIVGVGTWFVLQYRRRPGQKPLPSPHHNTPLEVTWSVLPGFLLAYMFAAGFTGYMDIRTVPADAEENEIRVTAKKWSWLFSYTEYDGYATNDLHCEVGKPFKLTMTSDDVLHSLFIPAFRVKMDVVPGRYTTTWFQPTQPGEYILFCTEYCGTKHSDMLARVIVHPQGQMRENLTRIIEKEEKETPPIQRGELLYNRRGCVQCHTTDGSAKVGPTFKGLFGSQAQLQEGGTITVDDNYIRESILEPNAKARVGFRKGQMPTFKGQLKDPQIDALIQYIKSLK